MDRYRRYRLGVVVNVAFWTVYLIAVFAALVVVLTALAGDHP